MQIIVSWSMLLLLLFFPGCNKNKDEKGKEHEQHQSKRGPKDHLSHDLKDTVNSLNKDLLTDHNVKEEPELKSLNEVIGATNNRVISNQATIKLQLLDNSIVIPAQGYIAFDMRRNNKMASRVGGRIEKLYTKYNYAKVRKGDKIMDLYSPELNTYQDEFLYLIRSSDKGEKLIGAGRKKLRLLGMTDAQINKLETSGAHSTTISIVSLYDGYIIFAAENQESSKMNPDRSSENGMSNSGVKTTYADDSDQIREGMYVNEGQTLFSVNDLDKVWAILSLETRFEPHFKVNDDFLLKSEIVSGKDIHGKVDFIEPVFKEQQRFLQVRIYLNNKDHLLKINSLVSGNIIPSAHNIWVIPSSASYDLGRRKVIWVYKGRTKRGAKLFEAREVITGIIQRDFTQILKGLDKSEEVALDAGYMVDSESFIWPASIK